MASKIDWQVVPFWQGLFLDEDGAPSFARVASGLLILVGCTWTTRVLWLTGTLPDLLGLTALIAAPYGANKLSTALSDNWIPGDQDESCGSLDG